MDNYCYTTLLGTDDYVYGVIGLYYSLKRVYSKYPLVVLVPDNISKKTIDILKENSIQYKQVTNNSFSDDISQINYKSTFNKFHCFNLVEYDKVMFLDADVVVYKNLDYYFLLEPLAAYRGYAGTITGGILLIKPDAETAKTIFENYYFCENDEQVLNIVFLGDFLKNKRYLLEDDNASIYHRADDIKYWTTFKLNTSEKVKDFIENYLWILKLREQNYHEERRDGFQNPQLRQIYLDFLNKNNIDYSHGPF